MSRETPRPPASEPRLPSVGPVLQGLGGPATQDRVPWLTRAGRRAGSRQGRSCLPRPGRSQKPALRPGLTLGFWAGGGGPWSRDRVLGALDSSAPPVHPLKEGAEENAGPG